MRAASLALATTLVLPHAASASVGSIATLVETAQVGADNSTTGPTVTLPGFDPSLGPLLGITLEYSGTARVSSDIRNYPGSAAPITLLPVVHIVADDFTGFQVAIPPVILPTTSGPVTAGFSFDQTEALTSLSPGPVTLSSWILADVTCGDCIADGDGAVSGLATLTITYDPPADVPEPGEMILAWLFGFFGLAFMAGVRH